MPLSVINIDSHSMMADVLANGMSVVESIMVLYLEKDEKIRFKQPCNIKILYLLYSILDQQR